MGLTPHQPQEPQPPMAQEPAAPMQPQSPLFQMSAKQVLEQYRGELDRLIREEIVSQVDSEKLYQLLDIRKNHLYLRSRQNLVYQLDRQGFVDMVPVSGGLSVASTMQSSQFDHNTNHYRGDHRKFVAVLGGQRPPNVRVTALPGDRETNIRRAKLHQKVVDALHYSWDASEINRQLAGLLATDGTVFFYTPYVTDAEKYGKTSEPNFSYSEQSLGPDTFQCQGTECQAGGPADGMVDPENPTCPHCGQAAEFIPAPTIEVASQDGETEYANGCVECHLRTGLHVTTPAAERLEQVPWLFDESERDRASVLAIYPELEAMLASGDSYGAVSTLGASVREQVLSYSGVNTSWLRPKWLYSLFWLRPVMYNLLQDKELKVYLRTAFPDGVKIPAVNTKLMDLIPEKLTDVWTACKPDSSVSLWSDPYFNDMIQFQDIINNVWNIMEQLAEYSIPLTLMDPSLMDIDQHNKRPRRVGEIVLSRSGGGSFQHKIFKFDPAKLDPLMANFIEFAISMMRENSGMLPPIFGGDEGSQTAKEATMKRNQALMSLSTVNNNMRAATARRDENAVRQQAKFSTGVIHLPNSRNAIDIGDTAELLQGGVKYEADEAMPMTAGERRDYIMELLTQNPQMAGILGGDSPSNLEDLDEILGMPEWEIPAVKAREFVLGIIRQLVEQAPIEAPPQIDMMTGLPMGPPTQEASIPPDPAMVDPLLALKICQEWLYGPEAAEHNEQNPIGFSNFLLYLRGWHALALPPPLMEGPPGGGDPGKGEEKGPPGAPPPAADPPMASQVIQ